MAIYIEPTTGARIHITEAREWEGYFFSSARGVWVYFGEIEGESRAAALEQARREIAEMGASAPVAVVAIPELTIYF
jgi:hypothetical protein